MHRILPVFAIAAISLTLSACTPAEPESLPEMSAPTTSKPIDPTSPAPKSDRGNRVKTMGEVATYLNADMEPEIKFRVDWIRENPACDYPDYPKPKAGLKRIELHLTVETTKVLGSSGFTPEVTFDPFLWKYIDSNGDTYGGDLSPMSGIVCETDSGVLATSFGPAEKGHGSIVMEVPDLNGILIYDQPGFEYDLAAALKTK